MDIKEMKWEAWTVLMSQDTDEWRPVVDTVIQFRFL